MEKAEDDNVDDLLAHVPMQKLSRREKREQQKLISEDSERAAVAPPGLAGSPTLVAAVNGVQMSPQKVQPVVSSTIASTLAALSPSNYLRQRGAQKVGMPASPALALGLNFDDYDDDDSDSDEEVLQPDVSEAVSVTEVFGSSWSRNEMLRLRSAMKPSGDGCGEISYWRTIPAGHLI